MTIEIPLTRGLVALRPQVSTTVPRTEAERAGHAEQLLAEIMTVSHVGGQTDWDRLRAVWRALSTAGYHYGQVDPDGIHVMPPHDGCRECDPPPAPLSNAGVPTRLGLPPAGAEPYPLPEAAGAGRDGDDYHRPQPTDIHPWDGEHAAHATCSACGQPLQWRRQLPDPATAAPRGAYEHTEGTR